MAVRRLTAGAGLLAALIVALLVGSSVLVLAAGVLGAVAALTVDRGTGGLAAASLALAAAMLLVGEGMAAASDPLSAVAAVAVAGGVAGCLTASTGGGRLDNFLGAWAALMLVPAAWFTAHIATAPPAASLVGSRLAWLEAPWLLVATPIAVFALVASGALTRWREAGLPPWLCTFGPTVALVGMAWTMSSTTPDLGVLFSGSPGAAPTAYTMMLAGTIAVFASLLAGAVAADDTRFRRLPAWLTVAVGPLCLAVVVSLHGGTFVLAALTAIPPLGDAFGALSETAPPVLARSFIASVVVAALAVAVTLLARGPGLRRLTAGRPAAVGAGCLVVAVALSDLPVGTTVAAGGLAVLAWVLLVDPPAVEPPPRTALSRASMAVGATAIGAVVAVALLGVLPDADPGIGGVLVLSGVAVLGIAMR